LEQANLFVDGVGVCLLADLDGGVAFVELFGVLLEALLAAVLGES
jgi:hypothetical protein